MPQGIVYMPQRGGQQVSQAGVGVPAPAQTFRKPTLQDGVKEAVSKDELYAGRIKAARDERQKQNEQLYGAKLGKVYDGHREAISFYRDHLAQKWKSGGYYDNPEGFSQDLAKLNAYIDTAENYYIQSYGDTNATGTGFTMQDSMQRATNGNSREFYEENGFALMDEDGNPIDEFDWAQERLDYVNEGGFFTTKMRINENGELVSAMKIDTGERDENGMPIYQEGEEMDIFQMPHVMDGARTFQPDMTTIASQTLFDLADGDEYQNQAERLQDMLINAAPESEIQFFDPYNDEAEDGYVTKKVGDLSELEQQQYISDEYWDNNITTQKFRRVVVDDIFPDLSKEQRQQFIENGEYEGMNELAMEDARRRWRETSRFAKENEKPKDPRKPTKDEKARTERRGQLGTAARIEPVPIEERVSSTLDSVDFGIELDENGNVTDTINDKKVARRLNEQLEGEELKHISAGATTWDGDEVVTLTDSNTKEEEKFYLEKGAEEQERMRSWIKDHAVSNEAPEGHQYTLTALKNSNVKVTVPDGDGGRVNVEPVDILFYPSEGKIVLTNLYHETGSDKGNPIPDVELKEGDRASASILKQIEDNLKMVYGPDATLASLMNKDFLQEAESTSTGNSGELD
jgi:hypothetical protein